MTHLTKRWQIATRIDPQTERDLAAFPTILRQILFNRGHRTRSEAKRFLSAAPPPGTEPYSLQGMDRAVDRIRWAIDRDEQIAVYGDYDADGVTATALLVEALSSLGADVIAYIPNRFDEGYGLNNDALDTLYAGGTRLVITVDCGIRSLEEAAHAARVGLDLIIVDHHHPGNHTPTAIAVINPKQADDLYPEKDLAGVGLAYKLAVAMYHDPPAEHADLEQYLDLVALGTVADLVPLKGENRSLVRDGLRQIQRAQRQGLRSLMGVAELHPHSIRATDIGFILGPRLNAAGRLDSALASFDLLTCSDIQEAGRLAQLLNNQNRERQKITRETQQKAEALALKHDPDALLLFAAAPEFNPGVVGLAASRLSERYYRPAIVVAQETEYCRGSCRSIQEFHITAALDQCADLLEHYGGHAAAAGFTVRTEFLEALVERMQAIAIEQLSDKDLSPNLKADLEVPLGELRPELLEHLDLLEPTGFGNPQPHFVSRDLRVVRSRTVGREGSHLKLVVTDGKVTFDAIAFRQGYWQVDMPEWVDLLYTFETNEYNNRVSLQLNVRDIKRSGL